jgi:hypothetical protein
MRALRASICLCLVLFLAACSGKTVNQPSNDRNWEEHVSRLATVHWETRDRFALRNVRNWEWNASGAARKLWETRRHDINDLQAIWFFVEPFPRSPTFAHTFLTFEFGEGAQREYLTVSVEARREVGEEYSLIGGMQGAFELIFAWSTERDILTDSVLHYGHGIEMYRTNVTPEQARIILRGFLARTNQLAKIPELYNTLRHNCTTELAAVVNREFDTPIPWNDSFIFTGHAARYLHSLGYLDEPGQSYARLRSTARIAPLIRHLAAASERRFSNALRQGLAQNAKLKQEARLSKITDQ